MNINTQKLRANHYMSSKNILHTLFAIITMTTLLIVSISTHHASAEAYNCHNSPTSLGRFIQKIPPTTLTATTFLNDKNTEYSIKDYRGNGVILNFWATWCPPCVKEMPALINLKKIIEKDNFSILALSEDRGGAKSVISFFEKQGLEGLDVLVDKKGKVAREYKVQGLPVSLLIDREGLERGRVIGIADWDKPEVVSFIKRCIG